MSDRISTIAGIFESGEKDVMGVQYKDGRLIACRNPKLTDYAVADGTEVICDRAFMNMKELRSIILPASLKAIGESAFSGCKALADITIPDGVTEIRQATFRDCDALVAIELPASVTEIEKFAFGRGLTTLVVNAPGMKIDRYAFMNARDFSTLMVPAGTADYYRALLADMRVKADVEEMEDNTKEATEESASGLDAFLDDPEEVPEETNQIITPYNMDEKKKKGKLVISFNGADTVYTRLWFCPVDNTTFEKAVDEDVNDLYGMSELGVEPREAPEFNMLPHYSDITIQLIDEDGNDITAEAVNVQKIGEVIDNSYLGYLGVYKEDDFDLYWNEEKEEYIVDKDIYQKYERILNCDFGKYVPKYFREAWKKAMAGEIAPDHIFSECLKQVLHENNAPGAFVAIDRYDEVPELYKKVEYDIEWTGNFDFDKLFIPYSDEYFENAEIFNENGIIDESIILDIIIYDGKMFSGYPSTDYKDRDEDEVDNVLSERRAEIFGVVPLTDLNLEEE